MKKYYHIMRINLQNTLMYATDFFITGGLIMIILFIMITMWTVLYETRPLIAGFTLKQMVWYLAITETIVFIGSRNMIKEIENEIKTGAIAYQLNKPYNYLLSKFSSNIGYNLIKCPIMFASASILAGIIVGMIEIKILGVIFGFIAIINSIILTFMVMAIIGIMAFWLEESQAIYFVYDKLRFILGGFLFPLEILPRWLEIPARYLPFSAMLYYPAKIFVDYTPEIAITGIIIQLIWITIFATITGIIYKIGIRKVSINGG